MSESLVFNRSALKSAARETMSKGGYGVYFILPLYGIIGILFQVLGFLIASIFQTNLPQYMLVIFGIFYFLYSIAIPIFIMMPFTLSMIRYFILYSRGEEPSIEVAFNPFQKGLYWRFLGVVFWESLWLILWQAMFYIPIIVLVYFFVVTGQYPGVLFLVFLLVIAAVVFIVYKLISYFTAFYLVADKSSVKIVKSLSMSKVIMKGHKMELFILVLSFWPWFLLSIITFGLANLYVLPYLQVTLAKYYDFIMEKTLQERGISK